MRSRLAIWALILPLSVLVIGLGTSITTAQQAGLTNTVAFQDFGWDADTQGASGSVTYGGVGGSFAGEVALKDLMPSHVYKLYLMDVGVTGATSLDSTTYSFTTDAQGSANISVAETFDVAEGAPLPAYQVHFLVVDESVDLSAPLPNPLGIAHPIALACSFPLGFLQLDVPTAPAVALNGDSVPLFNFGWAPYSEIGDYLAEADIGVCAGYDNLESRCAYRTVNASLSVARMRAALPAIPSISKTSFL
ncbi:MAG: hypothetical protein IH809_02110 [Proteobacteria bacterium]|nr:hypothetical protein [Pseudomonadota bacterium]